LASSAQDAISVVIATFERPEACERALRSVLAQTVAPLEVLICDDGSADETPQRFGEWERRCEQVRYLRVPTNTRTPASARNLGIANARADWVAFLDDDDEWLATKLELQRAAIDSGHADVIGTNALRRDGSPYFPDAPSTLTPSGAEMLAANPIITSSVVMRRSLAEFPTAVWMRGIEDYAAWLALADRGAHFLVLGEPLVRYQDVAADRLSAARAYRELAVARLAWQRLGQRPFEPGNARNAARRTAGAAFVVAADALTAARTRARRAKGRR
jgi:glycosyltransferase involved in cell wall biosynthesis